MRDGDIRESLRGALDAKYSGNENTLIRNELGLCMGEARVDLAVINGKLIGYEIKSARDTLARLPLQVEVYGRVLDQAWIVSGGRHVERVADHVPEWWGIKKAEQVNGALRIFDVRKAKANKFVDAYSVAQLLWRNEAFALLKDRELHRGLFSATRFALWDKLAESLTLTDLRTQVRQQLRARRKWSGG